MSSIGFGREFLSFLPTTILIINSIAPKYGENGMQYCQVRIKRRLRCFQGCSHNGPGIRIENGWNQNGLGFDGPEQPANGRQQRAFSAVVTLFEVAAATLSMAGNGVRPIAALG